jgi:hypothetical protein
MSKTGTYQNRIIKTTINSFVIVISILLFIMLSCGTLLFYTARGLCGNYVFEEIYSPNREYKAVVFQRDCGATTGFSTQVSILNSNDDLENKEGNVLGLAGHPDWTSVQVMWNNDQSLTIAYIESYTVYKNKDRYSSLFTIIDIEYQPRP